MPVSGADRNALFCEATVLVGAIILGRHRSRTPNSFNARSLSTAGSCSPRTRGRQGVLESRAHRCRRFSVERCHLETPFERHASRPYAGGGRQGTVRAALGILHRYRCERRLQTAPLEYHAASFPIR